MTDETLNISRRHTHATSTPQVVSEDAKQVAVKALLETIISTYGTETLDKVLIDLNIAAPPAQPEERLQLNISNPILDMKLYDTGDSYLYWPLSRGGIDTVREVVKAPEEKLAQIRGFSYKHLLALNEFLLKHDFEPKSESRFRTAKGLKPVTTVVVP